ncbi:MAG: phaA [Chloroflexi bacterium]|jgi:polyhydroxyalkanoate synthase|nr:phaA [Chloroflexota bacterium]
MSKAAPPANPPIHHGNSGDDTPVPGDPTALGGAEDAGTLALGSVLGATWRTLGRGRTLARAGLGLGADSVRVLAGRGTGADRGDWRFADPTWQEHPGYRRLMQLYLTWCRTLEELVERADVHWRTRERARFAVTVLTSAAAPTNTVLGNPAALKRAVETGGGSLVEGLRHLLSDVRHNRGMPSQVDSSSFRVGENLAVSPGAVVYRDEVCEILQYSPTTSQVRCRPVVMVTPQINKYYFMDLAPQRSFVEHAVSRGLTFFAISWRNPVAQQGGWNLDTYAERMVTAIDAAREITGSDSVNLLGICAGGVLASTVLSHLALRAPDRVHSASFGVTLLDFDVPAMVGVFNSRPLLAVARARSARTGVLDGQSLAAVFTWMRPNDLVWNYWVNNYLMGKNPPAFDILAWNADRTNLPAALHAQFLQIFAENSLVHPGAIEVLGTPVDLARVTCETYVTGGLSDHLTPWEGCYRATQLFSGPTTFVLSHTGHIQTMVNPPGNPKAHYFVGPPPGPDPQEWRAQSERRPGTWWDHWAEWILARSGEERPASARLGSRRHKPLDPAPGRYVLEG